MSYRGVGDAVSVPTCQDHLVCIERDGFVANCSARQRVARMRYRQVPQWIRIVDLLTAILATVQALRAGQKGVEINPGGRAAVRIGVHGEPRATRIDAHLCLAGDHLVEGELDQDQTTRHHTDHRLPQRCRSYLSVLALCARLRARSRAWCLDLKIGSLPPPRYHLIAYRTMWRRWSPPPERR